MIISTKNYLGGRGIVNRQISVSNHVDTLVPTLETINNNDGDKEKKGVIKIETIGDNFVITISRAKLNEYDIDDLKQITDAALSDFFIKARGLSHFRTYGLKKTAEKYNVGMFIHNVHHYSGGRYLAFLTCMSLARYMNVTMVTDYIPKHFLRDFEGYEYSSSFKIIHDVHYGKEIQKNDFDFVIGIPVEPAQYAQMYAERFGIPCYTIIFETPNYICKHRRGPDAEEKYWKGFKIHLQKNDGIVSISRETEKHTVEWLSGSAFNGRFKTIYPPINTYVADSVLEDDSIVEEENSIIFISRFVDHKNPLGLLKKIVKMPDPPKKVYLVGKYGGVSGSVLKGLQEDKSISTTIEMHTSCSDREKFELVKKSKVMIFPTIFEGFGMPPLEALYFGKRVLTYDIPVMKEVYGDKIDYVPVKDESAFVKKLGSMLKLNDIVTNEERMRFARGIGDLDSYGQKFIDFMIPLRLSVGMIVCNGGKYLKAALDSVYDIAYEIIIVEGAVEHFMFAANKDGSSKDNTVEIIKEYSDPLNKIKFVQGKWKDKAEMQNVIATNIRGDIYMKLDSDEVWKSDDLIKVLNMFRLDSQLMIVRPSFYHFWKGLERIAVGSQWDSKPARFWRWYNGFRHANSFNYFVDGSGNKVDEPRYKTVKLNNIHVYHLGYTKTSKEVKEKLQYYRNRGIEKRVKDTFTKWKVGDPTQPTHGGGSTEVFHGVLPEVLILK